MNSVAPQVFDRRLDRSHALSVALDKLLAVNVARHMLRAAVVADSRGLLLASDGDREHAARLAGVMAAFDALHGALTRHQVLHDVVTASVSSSSDHGITLWMFEVGTEQLVLALAWHDHQPSAGVATHLIAGVRRIFRELSAPPQ